MFMLGRRPMVAPKTAHKFRNYQLKDFPQAPPEGDYTPKAMASLSDIYLNDQYGCCVISWMAHAEGVFTGNATGTPVLFKAADIRAMYSAIGGFDENDPTNTDNGCDEGTALDYWLHSGFCGHKIAGSLAIDATNAQEVQDAIWLFENVMYGVGLPDQWVASMDTLKPGFTWDVAGNSDEDNGHCFGGVKWSPKGVGISTWGMLGTCTYAATAAYAVPGAGGQLFTVITPEILSRASGRAPNGFNWNQLVHDFMALGGTLSGNAALTLANTISSP